MNEIQIRNRIKEIFFQAFPNLEENDFSWEKQQKDYVNWDSFAQLNLITLTEAEFDIEFSLDESIEIRSANDLYEYTKSHLS